MAFVAGYALGGALGIEVGSALGLGLSASYYTAVGFQYAGAALGLYADYKALQRSLPDGPRRDRFGENRITTRDEGAPSNRAWGRTVRVPGHLVWEQWPIDETKHENTSGKGPGAGGEFLTYTYSQSVAVEWCKCWGRPISRVLMVWANGELVYNINPDASEASTLISATRSTSSIFPGPWYYHYATYETTSSGPDLTQFKAGKDLVVTGFTPNNGFNGSFEVVSTKLKSNGNTEVKVLISQGTSSTHPISADEPAGDSVTLFQSFPSFSKQDYAGVTHYTGTLSQLVDPTIETFEGPGEAPAYRDRAYSVFQDWRLENYGNMIPQTWEALIEVDPLETVANAVEGLLVSAGIEQYSIDASMSLDGFVTNSRTAPIEALAQLALAYDLMVTDQGGVVVVEPRSTVAEVTIPQSKLAAHPPGERTARDVQHEPLVERDLPAAVTVSYLDPAKDYEPGAETYVLQSVSTGRTELVQLNMVLSSAQAQAIARRVGWSARAAGHAMSRVQLPPSMLGTVRPGTLAHLPKDDLLVGSVLVGVNDVLQVAGAEEQRQTLSHTTENAAPGGN